MRCSLVYKILFLIFCFSHSLSWAETDVESAQSLLERMTTIYSQVVFMKADYEKVEKSSLLGTQDKSSGDLEYSKTLFRVEQKKPSKNLFIKGEKKFWNVSSDQKVVEGDVNKSIPSLFELMFSDPKVWKNFKVSYAGVPKKFAEVKVDLKNKIPKMKDLLLIVNLKKRTFSEVFYKDDLDNEVKIKFSNYRFYGRAPKGRFIYKK